MRRSNSSLAYGPAAAERAPQHARSNPAGPGRQALAGAVLAAASLFGVACATRTTPPGYAGDDARAFVAKHRSELQAEIATGSGPRIYDLAIIANCQDVPALGLRLHRHHDDFFLPEGSAPPGADAEVAERVVRFMSERRELRCLSLDLSRSRDMAAGRRLILPRRSHVTARGGSW
jgi:hypothetical protein